MQKSFKKHWPDVPCFEDIHNLTRGDIDEPIDIVCGGFPCQPFSTAGLQRGDQDDRFLWPEMLRVISEFRPAWVVGENVTGIISMALDQAIFDLESICYTVRAFNIPAVALDAEHERQRIWIVAHTDSAGHEKQQLSAWSNSVGSCRIWQSMPDPERERGAREAESSLCGGTDGVPAWVDRDITGPRYKNRIKALGNSIVPQVAYQIFDAINKAEASNACREEQKEG